MPQNGDPSKESNVRTSVFETKSVTKTQRRYRNQYGKDPPSDNAIRRWLKQFQEIGSVLHRKGAHRRKMLIESRKCFLEAHKNQLDQLFAVRYTTNNCLEDCSFYRK
jgi:hypothetical protein